VWGHARPIEAHYGVLRLETLCQAIIGQSEHAFSEHYEARDECIESWEWVSEAAIEDCAGWAQEAASKSVAADWPCGACQVIWRADAWAPDSVGVADSKRDTHHARHVGPGIKRERLETYVGSEDAIGDLYHKERP
jgi:hypothetical protein